MSAHPPRRRFIAGAVCPRCAAMDTMVVDEAGDARECVACGFNEPRPAEPPRQEVHTRVNRPQRQVDTPEEVVRLLDPDPAPEKH
ncbi:MAG: YheV family putative metal-binding protein [Parahaliea sp.]